MTTAQTIVVWLWLLVTGSGVVLTAAMMYLTRSDMGFMAEEGIKEGRLYEGMQLAFYQELRRFLVKLFLFFIGVESFFIPQPEPPPKPTWQEWVLTACLFGVVLLLNYSTISAMRYRHKYLGVSQSAGDVRLFEEYMEAERIRHGTD